MRRVDAKTALIAGFSTLAVCAPRAHAEEPVGVDWVAREPGAEIAVSALAVASHTIGFIDQRKSGWPPSWRLREDPVFDTASDLTGSLLGVSWQLAAAYALDVEYFSRLGVEDPTEAAGRTTIVDLQAVVLASGITIAFKKLTGRCRPRAVFGIGCNQHDAFPSGHTVTPAALAGSRFVLAVRSGTAGERYAAFGIAESMSLLTGAFRMLAGAHSWEDVLGGWAIGHATGTLLALAHPLLTPPREATAGAAGPLVAAEAPPVTFVWSTPF